MSSQNDEVQNINEAQEIEKRVLEKLTKILKEEHCVLVPKVMIVGSQISTAVNVMYNKPESNIITPEQEK